MAGRSRRGGGRGRRGRSVDPGRLAVRYLLWRTLPGKVWLFGGACRSHPMLAWGVATWLTVWFSSGSGRFALVATPGLWLAGGAVWFRLRQRRAGLSVAAAAAQLGRERRVRKQWDRACAAAGWSVSPILYRRPWAPGVRSEGDTVVARFSASAAGLAREPIVSKLTTLSEVVGGGCRSARMKALGYSGLVEIRFDFAAADPLAKVVTPNMLPAAPAGCVPYGMSEEGSPVYFRLLNEHGECVFTPLLIAGASRSGKSSTVWAQLLGFIAAGVPVEVYAADPKGGMELTALEDALNRRAGTPLFRVVEYADDPKGDGKKITAMVGRLEARMNERMAANKGRRKRAHVPTKAEPFLLLLIDELLLCDELLSKGKKGPLGRIQLAGAAAGVSVIGCTQLSRAADLNPQIRDLFVRRLVFRVPSKEAVETALGSGNGWPDKAPAHKLRDRTEDKGVGYAVDTEGMTSSSTEAVKFRSVWIDDEATAYIAEGEMPPGMERFARDEVQEQTFWHAHYLFFDAVMALVYTGETNDFDRRLAEHRARSPWFGEVVEDSEHMHVTWFSGATAKEAEAKAKAAESAAIRKMKPRHNKAENRNNPLRVIRRKPEDDAA